LRNSKPKAACCVHQRLDADLAAALMSTNAVKGLEIGDGFNAAGLRGEENADEVWAPETEGPEAGELGAVCFGSNHADGILGGISKGQDLVVRFAVKPTSSILQARRSIDQQGRPALVATGRRHDLCVGIRAVPVGEAMLAYVLADHLLRDRAQSPGRCHQPMKQ
jgi:chorismate synthase